MLVSIFSCSSSIRAEFTADKSSGLYLLKQKQKEMKMTSEWTSLARRMLANESEHYGLLTVIYASHGKGGVVDRNLCPISFQDPKMKYGITELELHGLLTAIHL